LVDHTGIGVADIQRSVAFYTALFQPLGATAIVFIDRDKKPAARESANLAGAAFGADVPVFWIDVFHPHGQKQHTAFRATTRAQVDDAHRAAIAAGGTDNGAPGLRGGGYPPGYYAAFVLDPDGNNIEIVFRE
ncbi:MAG TPA: VOC family protein, partial [Kofleriaceae bacterium]